MSEAIKLSGGLDLSSPTLGTPNGSLAACLNYEQATRSGYSRISGIEPFDGGHSPASFKLVQFGLSAVVGSYQIGEAITYGGRPGFVLFVEGAPITIVTCVLEGGKYEVANNLTLTGGVSAASGIAQTARIVFVAKGAQSTLQTALAALGDARRVLVKRVPGREGADVLGSFLFRDEVYAIRDLPRIYFENGYYPASTEGRTIVIGGVKYPILLAQITGYLSGFIVYDPIPNPAGTNATPIGSPTLATLPISGSLDSGLRTIPYSDGYVVSGGIPPYGWTLLEDDTGPDPPPDAGDLSTVRFLSEQTQAALWRALGAGDWQRVPGGREMGFSAGSTFVKNFSRSTSLIASDARTSGPKSPTVVTVNAVSDPLPSDLGSTAGSTLLASGFDFSDIPVGAEILGVTVSINRSCAVAGRSLDLSVTLTGITGQPENKARGVIPVVAAAVTYGSATDQWGIENITRADIVNAAFGVAWAINQNTAFGAAATLTTAITVTVTYAEREGIPLFVWNGAVDVPVTLEHAQVTSGDPTISTQAGYMHIVAAVNSAKPRMITVGDQIRSAAAGGGNLWALVASVDTPIFLPGQLEIDNNRSRYQFRQANFFGQDKYDSVYGVSGAGPAFTFDGTNIIKIRSPLSPQDDLPRHIAKHGSSLALGYFGGALLLTAPGDPFEVMGERGAVAIETGDRIMGLAELQGDALGVLCQSFSVLLRGLTALSFSQSTLSARRGAIEYTLADMGRAVVADSFGLFLADAPESYAPAERNYLSANVEELLRERLQALLNTEQRFMRPIAALPVRSKNQYRLYFRDGSILTMAIIADRNEFTLQRYFSAAPDQYSNTTPWAVRALSSGIDASGRERLFCSFTGLKAGFLYEMDSGNTLDGDPIPHFIELNSIVTGSGSRITRADRMFVFGKGRGYANLELQRATDYAETVGTDAMSFLIGRTNYTARITDHSLKGFVDFPIEGEELGLRFGGSTRVEAAHTLQELEIFIDDRGESRGDRGE